MPYQQALVSGSRHVPANGRHRQPSITRPRESDGIRVSILERPDSLALLSMLGRCSAETLYRRFHRPTGGEQYLRSRLSEADDGESYIAWADDSCVGLGNIHVCGDTADIGLLVEDARQRQGVGTALLNDLVCHARNNQAQSLRADVLADDDRFVLEWLSRIGGMKASLAFGVYTVSVDVSTGPGVPRRSSWTGPPTNMPDRMVGRSNLDQSS